VSDSPPSWLRDNLDRVRERISQSAQRAGRPPDSVRLVAVSKTKPASLVRAAYQCGQRDFGENYVQELLAKHTELSDLEDLRWHAIGHIQGNKARDVVRTAYMVHSVDSERIAQELAKRAVQLQRTLRVLVQVNVGDEPQKSGCHPDELARVLTAVQSQSCLDLRGLMTVPPHTDDPHDARKYFDRMIALRERHGGSRALPELSMGMTHDLDVAIEAGATIVRVGTAIFGERDRDV
jgi:PLP dependent protein